MREVFYERSQSVLPFYMSSLSSIFIALICLSLGCESSPPLERESHSERRVPATESPLFVYVASSLAEVAQEVTDRYHDRYPRRRVNLVITSSHSARLQLERGAPPGVFISATPKHIERLASRGYVGASLPFAETPLTLVTRADLKISELSQLPRAQRWGMGDPSVPIGELGWSLLKSLETTSPAGIKLTRWVRDHLTTQSLSARALRGRVMRGEVDAAVIYSADLRDLKGWRSLSLTQAQTSRYRARYILALTRSDEASKVSTAAQDWCAMLMSTEGRATLRRARVIPLQTDLNIEETHTGERDLCRL